MWSPKDDPRPLEDSPGLAPEASMGPSCPSLQRCLLESGAQTLLIWLSVPWFSLWTLDFKVLGILSLPLFNLRTCGLRAFGFFLVLFAFRTFSLFIIYHSTIFSCRSSNISRNDINVKEKNCHLILHPAGFVFDNYVNSTCKYLGGG